MKKSLIFLALAAFCGLARAEEGPVLGVWEQVVVAKPHAANGRVRRNFIFTSERLAQPTVFSGLADGGNDNRVLCCLKVEKISPITFDGLMQGYAWENEDADHLRHITGWKFIYEAELVPASSQNANMRELVKNLTMPGSESPYSAAVISASFPGAESVGRQFSAGGKKIAFSTRGVPSENLVKYEFSVDGKRTRFSEVAYPD
ncbi:hypothetical protein WM16_31620 [Burkholderia ubonensis]|uniref:Uncharacterized protein n=1 Tax=Burkholderia ubonensis TaxID=101571 RepID=A0A119UZP1_9BURK|nr:hypothetical protein [Burkholderia ubonensis]KWK83876.1 hypothetical protein WM16_31620 [Burkholderia ubonensis]